MRRAREDHPILITSAPESTDDELDKRRKKYALMMALRAGSIIGAALVYRYSIWLALALVLGSMVLPWCAVLIANDRPAKKKRKGPAPLRPGVGPERAITAGGEGRIVDG